MVSLSALHPVEPADEAVLQHLRADVAVLDLGLHARNAVRAPTSSLTIRMPCPEPVVVKPPNNETASAARSSARVARCAADTELATARRRSSSSTKSRLGNLMARVALVLREGA